MSKGVVVQLEYDTAHIMKNNGAFISCPRNPAWAVGDVVTIPQKSWLSKKVAIISCAASLVVLITSGIFMYNIPATYIEVSVNPSVQFTLNRFDRVIQTDGLNDEGENLIQEVSYKNLTLREAYARLFNRLENDGYLGDATVQLVVANNSQNGLDEIEQAVREASERYIDANNIQMSIKRYANDEYLSLSHPLPVIEIPNSTEKSPSVEFETPAVNEAPESEAATETPTSTPLPSYAPPIENTPLPSPDNTPVTRHWGNMHNGMQGGDWRNGWWDWDCGW